MKAQWASDVVTGSSYIVKCISNNKSFNSNFEQQNIYKS